MKVQVNELGIHIEDSELLRWNELKSIALEVVPAPYGTDIFWHLVGESRSLVFPMEAEGQAEALEAFQKLPGFNSSKILDALKLEEGMLLIWRTS